MSDPKVKISALPTATAVNDPDDLILNQGGVTKRAAGSLLVRTAQRGAASGVAALDSNSIVDQPVKLLQSGAGVNPAPVAFSGDLDTGFNRPNANEVGIVAGGTERLRIAADSFVSQPVISNSSTTGSVTTAHARSVLASIDSTASGARSAVVASNVGTASGALSAVIASQLGAEASASRSVVIASQRTINNVGTSLALGFSGTGDGSTANRTIHLFGTDGDVSIAGTLTQNATFTDFAEMMPNSTGAEIQAGVLLTMVDGAVQPANAGDELCGVVSHTAAVLAGDTPFCWQGRYMHDEFGRRLYEDVPDEDWEPGEGQTEADRPTVTALKENPKWNPDLPQVPRSERPDQWTPVGLIGQVFVRVTKDVKPGDRIAAGTEGVGVPSVDRTGVRCMTITTPYDAKRGYAIARCLINVQV